MAGGGSWGAYTSGALQALIEAGILKDNNIAAISGTSAGAANAAMLSHAANSGKIATMPKLANVFWSKVIERGENAGLMMMPAALGEKFPNLNPDMVEHGRQTMKLMQAWGMASQPGTVESMIEGVIGRDWSSIQKGRIKTYIGAVQVSSNRAGRDIQQHVAFENKDITPRTIAASGTLVGTSRIGNDYFVDGAYLKNPSMDELDDSNATDIIAIVLYPEPKTPIVPAHEDDIKPDTSRSHKTKFIGPEVYQHLAWLTENSDKRIHVIAMPHEAHWNETSKMNISREWITDLYNQGYQQTKDWIAKNAHNIGKTSSFKPLIARPGKPCPSCPAPEYEVA